MVTNNVCLASPTIYKNNTGILNPTYATINYKGNTAFECTFDHPVSVDKSGNEFNITKGNKWSIILAKGPLANGAPDYHGYSKEGNAVVSPTEIEFYKGMPNVFIGGTVSSQTLVQIHGVLMTLAWVFLAPLGMASAAVLKLTKYGNNGKWFKVHRAALYSVLILTIAAFIIIFVQKKWTWPSPGFGQDHAKG